MLSRAERKRILALRQRKHRDRARRFLAENVRVVEALITAGIEVELAVISSTLGDSDRGRRLAAALGTKAPIREVSESELRRLAVTETPQGVLVVAVRPDSDWPDTALVPERGQPEVGVAGEHRAGPWLVLDAVQDPGNFGTLVRSADAFGASGVVALPGTVDPWNPKSVRAAAGSSFHVPMVASDPGPAFEWLRRHGAKILAADAAGRALDRDDAKGVVALVVGNEGAGVSEGVRNAADAIVGVPMRGRAESLNVAVAAGILLYQLTREG